MARRSGTGHRTTREALRRRSSPTRPTSTRPRWAASSSLQPPGAQPMRQRSVRGVWSRNSVRFRARIGGGRAQTRVGLTSASRASRPLTNPGESSVESDGASSTASEIATAVGDVVVPDDLPRAEAQDGAVDAGHPRRRPPLRVRRDQLVDLGPSASTTPLTSSTDERGSAAARSPEPPAARASRVGDVEAALVGLEEQVQRALTGLDRAATGQLTRPR